MTDYYAVLKKAVSGFESESGDARRSVYDKARTALIGQLKSIDPPLTTSEISRQRLELEEAIRKVEREASAARPAPVRVSAAAAVAEALAVPAEPESLDESEYADELEHELEEAVAPPPPPAPSPAPAAVAPPPAPPPQDVYSDIDDGEEPEPEPVWHEPEPEQAPPAPPVRQPPPVQPQWPQVSPTKPSAYDRAAPQGRREPPMVAADPIDEPRFDVDADRDDGRHFSADADWAPEPMRVTPMDNDGLDEPRERRASRRERNRDVERPAVYVERAKPSRWPTLILLVLIGLMLGGIAALAWSQRGVVKDVIGDLISSADTGAKPTLSEDAVPTASAPVSSKNADRLGGAPEEAPKAVRTVEAQPATDGEEADPLAGVMTPEGTGPVAAAPAASEPAPAPSSASDAGTADESLVAQKAILYEQPTDGSQNVKIVNANVTWKFNANSPNGPEIQANLDVPEKNMKVTLNIRKNNDPALPASHLVEIVVDTPADFAGGGIKSVPALVMKPTEESRGQPLDGAAAKVADGFFWIAFSNDAGPLTQNVGLMRERNWIDLPLVYNNDQRAILTFEKGTPGQRVFDKAMTAWGNK
ncbi:hypothetical protein OSH10_03555 [Kaistia defluvii]|uniref:hypothetical protein n=1 Tax=Kaistia defluvii TaxID=410841 RepID=UPI002258B6FB|nr:hypothetical protein [Kaistia defluvii]MCX5517501.1 hypothetical protein [Kaistia defluvii]